MSQVWKIHLKPDPTVHIDVAQYCLEQSSESFHS